MNLIFISPFQNGVTAMDVANVFGHKNVCEELRAHMGSGRKGEQEETTVVSSSIFVSYSVFEVHNPIEAK